jgi:hypothetical protein
MEVEVMERRKLSGWSLVGLGIIVLILFLLFPRLTTLLLGIAIIIMIILGFISLFAGSDMPPEDI